MDSGRDIDLPMKIALGWTLLLVTMVFGFSAHILFSIFEKNDFASLFNDPGPQAAGQLLYMFWFLSSMPIYMCLVARTRARGVRWSIVAIAALLLLMTIAHEWGHWQAGERPDLSSHIIAPYARHHTVMGFGQRLPLELGAHRAVNSSHERFLTSLRTFSKYPVNMRDSANLFPPVASDRLQQLVAERPVACPEIMGDGEVTRYHGGSWTSQQMDDRLASEVAMLEHEGVQYWPMFLLETGEHAGCCGLHPRDKSMDVYELGCHLRRAFRSQALGREAAHGGHCLRI